MKLETPSFVVGDVVITALGETGKIVDICKCGQCHFRGFYEPVWVLNGTYERRYITYNDAQNGFKGFYKIGEQRFDDFDLDTLLTDINCRTIELERLKKQLEFIRNEVII